MKHRAIVRSLVVVALLLSAVKVSAQRFTTDELPKIPLDTIDTADPKTKIITFTNNTWRYYFPNFAELVSGQIFTDNWVTDSIFAFRGVSFKELPESIELLMINKITDFCPPLSHPRILSPYGSRGRRMHKGIDLSARLADPVKAAFEGRVRYARFNGGGYGNLVIVRHPNGLESYYGHLAQLNVKAGDYVAAGQVIGYAGSTGRSRGVHLHFELRYKDYTIDPERVIDFTEGVLKYQTFVLQRGYFNTSSRSTEDLEENDDTNSYFASADGTKITSEEILDNIEKVQAKPQKTINDVVYHKVKRGDTLYSIARRYGTTVNAICKMNNIKSSQTLMVGKQLRVK
ncbi:MAG: M23 family metallopeptidase [Tidjanibacter sp.]|nr:M23 family metallopeptidase [Tidjanibacter sp.]